MSICLCSPLFAPPAHSRLLLLLFLIFLQLLPFLLLRAHFLMPLRSPHLKGELPLLLVSPGQGLAGGSAS